MDASSTVQHLLPHLSRFEGICVITNSLQVLQALHTSKHRLISTGGNLIPRNMALVGRIAENTLQNLTPSIAFFSAQGVDHCGDISDSSEEETALRRVVLQRATRRVFLCDHSKIGKQYLYRLCNLRDLDDLITDESFPKELQGNGESRADQKGDRYV
jgi:DeoR/GlpR family transcriptional regulator of sugar metabolism